MQLLDTTTKLICVPSDDSDKLGQRQSDLAMRSTYSTKRHVQKVIAERTFCLFSFSVAQQEIYRSSSSSSILKFLEF